jgi:hypothetical protein
MTRAPTPTRSMTAAIYPHAAGLELRVHYGEDDSNVIDSCVSRDGDAALLVRAEALKTVLEEHGWQARAEG